MTKEQEIMTYLHEKVFDPILNSPAASTPVKRGVRLTIVRMNERDAKGMLSYFWGSVVGTPKSIAMARAMKAQGFVRFEEVIEEFREKFNDILSPKYKPTITY